MVSKLPSKRILSVKTKIPKMISMTPNALLMMTLAFPKRLMNAVASEVKMPTMRNGTPKPIEYERRRKKAETGAVVARARMLPRTAPAHGDQPTAKARPKTKEVRKLELNFLARTE